MPCAHAPALCSLPLQENLDPRTVAEELGHTFLPCVLVGLSRAPDLIPLNTIKRTTNISTADFITIDQLGAVVAPDGALGGEAVLGCIERDVPLVVVTNPGVLKVNLESLGLNSDSMQTTQMRIYTARNYIEAAGILLALRESLTVHSLQRPIHPVREIE